MFTKELNQKIDDSKISRKPKYLAITHFGTTLALKKKSQKNLTILNEMIMETQHHNLWMQKGNT